MLYKLIFTFVKIIFNIHLFLMILYSNIYIISHTFFPPLMQCDGETTPLSS
jgi:hypothetical protein